MRIETPSLSETVLGKRLIQVVSGVAQAADALRNAWAQTQRPAPPTVQPQSLVSSFLAAGRRAVGMPNNKGEFQLGRWEEQRYLHQQNEALSLLIRSQGARYAKTTDGMGIEPYAWGAGQISEITPIRIRRRSGGRLKAVTWIKKSTCIRGFCVRTPMWAESTRSDARCSTAHPSA